MSAYLHCAVLQAADTIITFIIGHNHHTSSQTPKIIAYENVMASHVSRYRDSSAICQEMSFLIEMHFFSFFSLDLILVV